MAEEIKPIVGASLPAAKVGREIFQGLLIGAGGILPGISGAALAVVFGVFEEITALIAHPKRNFLPFFQKHWVLAISIGSGFILFTILLDQLFTRYSIVLIYIFSGFIAGTLPGIFKEARKKSFGRFEILSFLLSVGPLLMYRAFGGTGPNHLSLVQNITGHTSMSILNTSWVYLAAGATIGAGSLMPGISASFILIYFGIYGPLLDAVSKRDIFPLIIVGIGALISIALLSRIMNWLYSHFHGIVSFAVLGLTLGSLILVFPGFPEGKIFHSALASGAFIFSLVISSQS